MKTKQNKELRKLTVKLYRHYQTPEDTYTIMDMIAEGADISLIKAKVKELDMPCY